MVGWWVYSDRVLLVCTVANVCQCIYGGRGYRGLSCHYQVASCHLQKVFVVLLGFFVWCDVTDSIATCVMGTGAAQALPLTSEWLSFAQTHQMGPSRLESAHSCGWLIDALRW